MSAEMGGAKPEFLKSIPSNILLIQFFNPKGDVNSLLEIRLPTPGGRTQNVCIISLSAGRYNEVQYDLIIDGKSKEVSFEELQMYTAISNLTRKPVKIYDYTLEKNT